MIFFFLAAMILSPLYAEEEAPEVARSCPQETTSQLAIEGIVLTGSLSRMESYSTARGVHFENLPNIGQLKPLREKLSASYLHAPLTEESIQEMKATILNFYLTMGDSIVTVDIPNQDVSQGVVVFAILEAKAGDVTFTGNQWFKDRALDRQFAVETGSPLKERELLNDAAWWNRNPFRHTEVVLSPGRTKGFTDVDFMTRDRFPMRVYSGVDNTGTEVTKTTRIFAGFNSGDTFGIGDLFTYQFTSAPSFHRFTSHYANYTSYLYWKHQLILYGGFAEMHPKISGFQNEAKCGQASLRYEIPFKPLYTPFSHELTLGFDWKNINSNLFFASDVELTSPIVAHSVNLTQFYGGYAFNHKTNWHNLTFKLDLYESPVKWFRTQKDSLYQELRPFSKVRYFYGRAALGDIFKLSKGFAFSFLLRGQVSSQPLLSSEQFGLGGADTVRGYEERSYNADQAVCGNFEFHTPSFSVLPKMKHEFYLLFFLDAAKGWNRHPTDGFFSSENLIGTGVGARLGILPYITARVDYGFQLHAIPGDDQFGQLHFSVIAGY